MDTKRIKLSAFPKLDCISVIHSDGTNLAYQDRRFQVFGPCTEEMLGFVGASNNWKRVAAGLDKPVPQDPDYGFPVPALWVDASARRVATGPGIGEALAAVSSLAEEDSPRAYGTVVCLDPERGAVVATDGFRLAWSRASLELKAPVCLPKIALKVLLKIAKAFPVDWVDTNHDDTSVLFVCGPYRVFIRTSAVKFPNYAAVLPKREKLKEVDPAALAAALALVLPKIKAARKSEPVELTLDGVLFNARFLAALPAAVDTVLVGRDAKDEEPAEIICGATHFVVCPIKPTPKDEKKSTGAEART